MNVDCQLDPKLRLANACGLAGNESGAHTRLTYECNGGHLEQTWSAAKLRYLAELHASAKHGINGRAERDDVRDSIMGLIEEHQSTRFLNEDPRQEINVGACDPSHAPHSRAVGARQSEC